MIPRVPRKGTLSRIVKLSKSTRASRYYPVTKGGRTEVAVKNVLAVRIVLGLCIGRLVRKKRGRLETFKDSSNSDYHILH